MYPLEECHVQGDDVCSYLWGDSKYREVIAINNERDCQSYYGGLNLLSNQFIARHYGAGNRVNSVIFLEEIKALHTQDNSAQKLLLIWDGASYHRGEKMKKFSCYKITKKSEKIGQLFVSVCRIMPRKKIPLRAFGYKLKTLVGASITDVRVLQQLNDWWRFSSNINFLILRT